MDKGMFFCVKYNSREDGFDILMYLSDYDLKFSLMIKSGDTGVIVAHAVECKDCGNVDCNSGHESFRLAEMAFQMNHKQTGALLCPVCEKTGVGDCCGHLTFVI